MKLYNPFKLHIVQFADGTYAVRKRVWRGLFSLSHCWRYLTNNSKNWEVYVYSYCKHKSYENAFLAMANRAAYDAEEQRCANAYALGQKVTKVIA